MGTVARMLEAAEAGYVRKSEACVLSDIQTLSAAVAVLDSWGYGGIAAGLSLIIKGIERDLKRARRLVKNTKGNGG